MDRAIGMSEAGVDLPYCVTCARAVSEEQPNQVMRCLKTLNACSFYISPVQPEMFVKASSRPYLWQPTYSTKCSFRASDVVKPGETKFNQKHCLSNFSLMSI